VRRLTEIPLSFVAAASFFIGCGIAYASIGPNAASIKEPGCSAPVGNPNDILGVNVIPNAINPQPGSGSSSIGEVSTGRYGKGWIFNSQERRRIGGIASVIQPSGDPKSIDIISIKGCQKAITVFQAKPTKNGITYEILLPQGSSLDIPIEPDGMLGRPFFVYPVQLPSNTPPNIS